MDRMPPKMPEPTASGSLSPDAMRDLWVWQEFARARRQMFSAFLGANIRGNPHRDELLRLILLEHGRGQHRRLSFYVREMNAGWGRAAIRDEIDRLSHLGVLILENDPNDARAMLVRPSARFVDWYTNQVPKISTEWDRLYALWNEAQKG
jgi:hypothetical protein